MTPPLESSLRIDPATERDVPTIIALIRALAEYERLADQMIADDARLRESLFGAHPAAEAVIARIGDEAVGFAIWFHNYSTFLGRRGLYLEDLFVQPEWRGRGVGRALLTHLARVAVARGCGRMEWSVLDWNEPAIAFYKRLGAQVMDEWTVFRLAGDALRQAATGTGA
jgi:GNAT superfamily N-acetyltransferase